MASHFVPKGQEKLLLRGPLTYEFSPTPYLPKATQESHTLGSLSERDCHTLKESGMTRKSGGVYTRNNPHPARVRHMKGLLDIPICYVEDNVTERRLLSPPSGTHFGPPFHPQGSTRYGANKLKGVPAVGVVPVTYAWQNELERKAQVAINKVLGQPPISRRGDNRASESSSRHLQHKQKQEFGHINDEKVLDLLCKILQTNSIPSCQAWLANATDTEKNIVMNMIRMVTLGELDSSQPATRPQTHESQYRYSWSPKHSWVQTPSYAEWYHGDDRRGRTKYGNVGTEVEASQKQSTFQHPDHDAVIKTARQLASLVSRQSSRAEKSKSLDLSETQAFKGAAYTHGRFPSQKYHWRSSSLSGLPTGMHRHSSRPRSKSANLHRVQQDPPLPGRERVGSGTPWRKTQAVLHSQ